MTDQSPATPASPAPDRAAIRAQLESVRKEYLDLLDSLSAEDWKAKSANHAWTVGQLMWHLGRGVEFFSQNVDWCRKGKAPNPPTWIVNPGNVLITRIGSRGATKESAREKYESAHQKLLACLETVREDEWGKSVTAYGTKNSIESSFGGPAEHLAEHKTDILKGLGRQPA